jgi:hypothetical protein
LVSQRLHELTLIILVVIFLGIFCLVGVFGFGREAKELALKTELGKIRSAVQFFYAHNLAYPATLKQAMNEGLGRNMALIVPGTDSSGSPRDPFGRKYLYNPLTGNVRSQTPGCEGY